MALTTESDVVKVSWGLDSLDLSTYIEFFHLVAEVSYGRVRRVVRPEDLNGFLDLVRAIDILNYKNLS